MGPKSNLEYLSVTKRGAYAVAIGVSGRLTECHRVTCTVLPPGAKYPSDCHVWPFASVSVGPPQLSRVNACGTNAGTCDDASSGSVGMLMVEGRIVACVGVGVGEFVGVCVMMVLASIGNGGGPVVGRATGMCVKTSVGACVGWLVGLRLGT